MILISLCERLISSVRHVRFAMIVFDRRCQCLYLAELNTIGI